MMNKLSDRLRAYVECAPWVVSEAVELETLVAKLKQEAQIHAQEARTANSIIAEIYQVCTGGNGEPGNWHGAKPVICALAQQVAVIAQMRLALERCTKYTQEDYDALALQPCPEVLNKVRADGKDET